MEYEKLVKEKIYDDMTDEEFDFCVKVETEYYRDKVNNLREENVPDYKIAAYIYDLWQDSLIADDAKLADAYNISDEDWENGVYCWWHIMEEDNPLID